MTYTYKLPTPWTCPAVYCATDAGFDTPEWLPPPPQPSPPPLPPPPPSPPPGIDYPPPPPPMPPSGWCHPECPQGRQKASVLSDYWRSVENQYSFQPHTDAVEHNRYRRRCDRGADSPMTGHSQLNVSSWYFFDGEAGNQMPTTPPSYEACGTTSPGWLATGHPNAGEPPSYGLVCFRDARTGANAERSCRHHLEVRVCACSFDNGVVTTYFYKLPEPPVCDMAYCGTRVDVNSLIS